MVSQKPKMTEFGLPETKSAGDLRFTIYDLRVVLRDENRARIGVGMATKSHKTKAESEKARKRKRKSLPGVLAEAGGPKMKDGPA